MSNPELVIMGGGNMAWAIVRGALHAHLLKPQQICICEPDIAKHAAFQSQGLLTTDSHTYALQTLKPGGAVVLAVKPQVFDQLVRQMKSDLHEDSLLISILAGIRINKIKESFGSRTFVIRVMPNLAVSVLAGMSAMSLGPGVEERHAIFVEKLFGSVGKVERLSEDQMDAFTAVAGSGPAYVFYLAEAMHQAAVSCGLMPEQADHIVRQTILGSALMLSSDASKGFSPRKMREMVTSKGGTTEAAVRVLDDARVHGQNVMERFEHAIQAARDRGRELGSAS